MRINQLTKLGMLLALGLLFSYIELMLPIVPGIPGIKIGLSNALVILILYNWGITCAFLYQTARILLVTLLFGNLFSFGYSLFGAVLSLLIMFIFKRMDWFDLTGVSMIGGVSHNIGQLMLAFFIVSRKEIFFYLPVLVLSGAVCGLLMGILGKILFKRRLL